MWSGRACVNSMWRMSVGVFPSSWIAWRILGALPGKPVSISAQPSDASSRNVLTGPTGIAYSPGTICFAVIHFLAGWVRHIVALRKALLAQNILQATDVLRRELSSPPCIVHEKSHPVEDGDNKDTWGRVSGFVNRPSLVKCSK